VLRSVLVANRGEIAVRIIQAVQELGLRAVAVYSDPDADAPHVRLADAAYPLGGASAADTYLAQGKLIDVAFRAGADAVHPGYGFLSENADFADALEQAGIALIGPPAAAVRAMGDKIEAKRRMHAAGVPTVPGWDGEVDGADDLTSIAAKIGYPLLVKAAAGGGGKGMRRVDEPDELDGAVAAAQREAEKAFGDGRVFLERYLTRPRHVEVQVFGDQHGSVVHLFERECSIQRRHQKIVEESPSPTVDADLRRQMGESAVAAARAIGYQSAGTVEFILGDTGEFYFLEMNTRLQVEHPVTELVTGYDLVHAQLRVAAGEPLPFTQSSLVQRGHAVECRVYAEDPANGFVPSTGVLRVYRPPRGPGIRVDSGVVEGSEVTVHYDPMLAKVITWGEDRAGALRRMDWALAHFPILGVRTNLGFLRRLIAHPEFAAGRLHTHFLEEHPIAATPGEPPDAALASAAMALSAGPAQRRAAADSRRPAGPWLDGGAWRLGECRRA
jgi:acetyl-CoA carboxylase biotin carboxylase subunit